MKFKIHDYVRVIKEILHTSKVQVGDTGIVISISSPRPDLTQQVLIVYFDHLKEHAVGHADHFELVGTQPTPEEAKENKSIWDKFSK